MPSRHDEFRREPITAKILGALRMVHSDREILVNLKVEMGGVDAMIVTDGADLFSFGNLLSLADLNPVEVCVKGVGEPQLPVLDPGMAYDDHVTPSGMDVPSKHDQTVSDGVNRFAKAAGAASVSHKPVLSHVATRAKPA